MFISPTAFSPAITKSLAETQSLRGNQGETYHYVMGATKADEFTDNQLNSIFNNNEYKTAFTNKAYKKSNGETAHLEDIDYFNDSKGTNIGSTMAAIEGLGAVYAPKGGKLLLILGGQGKGQQFGGLTPLINQYVSQVICIGEDAQLIEQHLRAAKLKAEVTLHQCQTLQDAFVLIQQVTASSLSQVKTVLLSPACASFDQFSGYVARGDYFAQLVQTLATD